MIPANREDVYRALLRKGMTKQMAARIANAGRTKAGRKRMSRKAQRTRKLHIKRLRRR